MAAARRRSARALVGLLVSGLLLRSGVPAAPAWEAEPAVAH